MELRTEENYRGIVRNHILPRWGSTALGEVTALAVSTWRLQLRSRYAAATVTTILAVLSMLFADAVDERLIVASPVRRRRRRGRRHDGAAVPVERVWALPEQVIRIAGQARSLGGPSAGLLIITAAWTGCRWGELAGLQRHHLRLHPHRNQGTLVIDRHHGALHESASRLWLGPPKTPASARTISLPPFLVAHLREHLARSSGEFVFTSPRGHPLRRSTFDRRVFRPSVDGNHHQTHPRVRTDPVRPGLTFHGLRHSHKTWLIADNIPEIAQARRLGHHLNNRLVEVYSHVAPELETRLLHCLERRWQRPHPVYPPVTNRPIRQSRRAPHTVPAQCTTPRQHHPTEQPQLNAVHNTSAAADLEVLDLQNSSISVHLDNPPRSRTAIIKRIRQALRPGKTSQPQEFDQEWS